MPENDELDLLLDAALATYADPGPDSGLEQRVLAAVAATRAEHAASAKPRSWWLPWAIAVPFAAGLLILWLSIGRMVHAPSTQPQLALHPTPPANQPHIAETLPAAHTKPPSASGPRHNAATLSARLNSCADAIPHCGKKSIPKLDLFPTPTPLTEEERALLAAADTGSPSEREALIVSQQHTDAPLSIAALNIPPLAASGEGKN